MTYSLQNGRFQGASLVWWLLRHGSLWPRQFSQTGAALVWDATAIWKRKKKICCWIKKKRLLLCSSFDFGTGKGNGNQADSGSSHRCRDCEAQGGEALSTFSYFHIVTVIKGHKGIKCLINACCCPCADYLCFGFIICFFHRDPLSLMSRRDTEWCEQSNGWTR